MMLPLVLISMAKSPLSQGRTLVRVSMQFLASPRVISNVKTRNWIRCSKSHGQNRRTRHSWYVPGMVMMNGAVKRASNSICLQPAVIWSSANKRLIKSNKALVINSWTRCSLICPPLPVLAISRNHSSKRNSL
jgi:hypothetical protein